MSEAFVKVQELRPSAAGLNLHVKVGCMSNSWLARLCQADGSGCCSGPSGWCCRCFCGAEGEWCIAADALQRSHQKI